tara:strand:+ start:149 stop:1702 length:1554 start_codon:yes stop_codon:yes gene_type:complete
MSDDTLMRKGSQVLSLVPQNQQEFTAGQKCVIIVPPDIGYLKGRSSYLVVDVLNTSPTFQRWMLPGSGQCLISQLDIFAGSGAGGLLLESLQNYNQWAAFEDQYIHNDQTARHPKEGQRTPADQYTCTGLGGAGLTAVLPTTSSADGSSSINGQISPLDTSGNPKYVSRRLCIPLKCGVFRWWDSEKLTPVIATSGIRIEITFGSNAQVCQNLASLAGTTVTKCTRIPHGIIAAAATTLELTGVKSIEESGLAVGNVLETSTLVGLGAITALGIAGGSGDVEVTFTTPHAAGEAAANLKVVNHNAVSYKVTKCELRAVQIVPPASLAQKALSGMKFQYTTYNHFVDTVLTSSRRHVTEIPSVASRGKSMISLFSDVNEEEETISPSYYTGIDPTQMSMNSVQYFLANRAYPLRAYDPRIKSDRCITQNELVKAFSGCDKVTTSLGSADSFDLDIYSQTFGLGRELARGSEFSYDLRSAEPQLRLGFSAVRTTNTRVNTFVFSDVVLSVGAEGLQIEL